MATKGQKIPGTNLAAPVVPFTADDVYPTHYAQYGKGGFRTVVTLEDLDLIPQELREDGMLVYVSEEGMIYQYEEEDNVFSKLSSHQIGGLSNNKTLGEDIFDIQKRLWVSGSITPITYAELVTLRTNESLIPCQWYRITDYITIVANDPEARSAEHPFDLLVMATSRSTLSEEARAIVSERDTDNYFEGANLSVWRLWYCLDNDVTRFAWADTKNGKGVIWRMVDEWQNDCPYDFKNVQFKRYLASTSSNVLSNSINGKYYAYNGKMNNVEIANEEDFVWAYTFTIIDENKQWVDYSVRKEGALGEEPGFGWGYVRQLKIGKCEYNHIRNVYTAITIDDEHYRTLMLNNIVLISTIDESIGLPGEMQLNEFGSGNYNMTLKDNPEQNHFGSKCYNNIVGSYSNTFENDCNYNTFGNDCDHNTFENYCDSNTFGNDCNYNTFGNYCYSNTFGNYCDSNTFGNYCYSNTFGNGCYSNTFGNYFRWNTFENGCYGNTFGNGCYGNTFGNGCGSNTFGNYFRWNTFGNYLCQLTVFDGVYYVSVIGGESDSSCVQTAQILNGTRGKSDTDKLQITFQTGVEFTQIAALKSTGELRIWNPADGV